MTNFSLFIFIYFLQVQFAFAFEPNAAVYASAGDGSDWKPGRYVGARSDCVLLERILPYPIKLPFLTIPSNVPEEKIEVGQEVHQLLGLSGKKSILQGIVNRVRAVKQNCHEVKYADGDERLYILPGNLRTASEFRSMSGLKKQFVAGDKVYAQDFRTEPERWRFFEVVAKRSDCFETDSPKVLSGYFLEDEHLGGEGNWFFSVPDDVKVSVKKGDKLDKLIAKNIKSEFKAEYTSLEGFVVVKAKEKVVVKPANEDCDNLEPIPQENIRNPPRNLSLKQLLAINPGDVVLEQVDPACGCCSVYYLKHKVTTKKRECYVLRDVQTDQISEVRIASQLIPAESLTK